MSQPVIITVETHRGERVAEQILPGHFKEISLSCDPDLPGPLLYNFEVSSVWIPSKHDEGEDMRILGLQEFVANPSDVLFRSNPHSF
jgi:hypothetical protein